jgi:hypothetical protein
VIETNVITEPVSPTSTTVSLAADQVYSEDLSSGAIVDTEQGALPRLASFGELLVAVRFTGVNIPHGTVMRSAVLIMTENPIRISSNQGLSSD